MPLSSWDDYPVHQAAEFIAHPATSDRNFYDRYYFNMHPCSGDWFAIFGYGQYPNLGVVDAFIDVRHGGSQHVVRASGPLTDRGDLSVGPKIIDASVKKRMKAALKDIQSGKFAKGWINEYNGGYKKYNALLKAGQNHPIEKVGGRLRAMMPWMKKRSIKGAQAAY